jgi:flagellar basal-body rod modification protein FlgD
MSGLQMNSITAAGSAAAARVASALAPRQTKMNSAEKTLRAANEGDPGTAHSDAAPDGATITASDFLVLLVTELKNQDPTQPTDPNAYIQQLVGVNSLQQLISINKNLTPPVATPPASGT